MKVKIIAVTKPLEVASLEQLIEYAGRKCTATTDKTSNNTANFVKARIKQGHTSILEHVSFTFEIDGISRSCLAQLTRHRIASFSVASMRYIDQQFQTYTLPEEVKANPEALELYETWVNDMFLVYESLIDLGIPKEDARFVLPIATHTDLVMTMNLRSLLNFFALRLDDAAQWEIKELAQKIQAIIKEYCPNVST